MKLEIWDNNPQMLKQDYKSDQERVILNIKSHQDYQDTILNHKSQNSKLKKLKGMIKNKKSSPKIKILSKRKLHKVMKMNEGNDHLSIENS